MVSDISVEVPFIKECLGHVTFVHTSCNNSAAAWLPIVLKSTLFSLTVTNKYTSSHESDN